MTTREIDWKLRKTLTDVTLSPSPTNDNECIVQAACMLLLLVLDKVHPDMSDTTETQEG